jgi:hypothetical protein
MPQPLEQTENKQNREDQTALSNFHAPKWIF